MIRLNCLDTIVEAILSVPSLLCLLKYARPPFTWWIQSALDISPKFSDYKMEWKGFLTINRMQTGQLIYGLFLLFTKKTETGYQLKLKYVLLNANDIIFCVVLKLHQWTENLYIILFRKYHFHNEVIFL